VFPLVSAICGRSQGTNTQRGCSQSGSRPSVVPSQLFLGRLGREQLRQAV
jgi:hypothetical protein